MLFPEPRKFWWLPVSGHRHAFPTSERSTGVGQEMASLCNQKFTRPEPPSDMDWHANTCETCLHETCVLVGLRKK